VFRVNLECLLRRKKAEWLKNQPSDAENISVETFLCMEANAERLRQLRKLAA